MRCLFIIFILPICTSAQQQILLTSATTAVAASVPTIQTITTSASATPTTTNITLTVGNAIRVWTGETTHSESGFNLYFRRNGGTVSTVRMYRWQGRILNAANGDSISLGTDDGRTLQVAAMTVPASLISPTGTNGTVNCDKAGPPIWTPTAAHITLPSAANAFTIDSTNVERIVFISEYDGTTWSHPRWIWTQTNYSVRVQCNYTQVALANYDGVAIGITAPTGTTIGGTSATMTFGLPAITGSSNYCTTAAEFQAAISNSVSGDRIVLAAGTYSLTTNIIAASFAANNGVGGKVGMEGICIAAESGAAVTVSRSSPAVGNWSLNQSGASGYSQMTGISFDLSIASSTGPFVITSGKWKFENCSWTGATNAGTGMQLQTQVGTGPIDATLLWCLCANNAGDNFGGSGYSTNNAASLVRYVGCESTNAGPAASSQCLTTHNGQTNYAYGCKLVDANDSVIANGAATDVTYADFIMVSPGVRKSTIKNSSLFGAHIVHGAWQELLPTSGGYCLFSRFIGTNLSASTDVSADPAAEIMHNRYQANAGRVMHNFRSWVMFTGNIIDGFGEPIRVADYSSGVYSNGWYLNNTVVNASGNAFNIAQVGVPLLTFMTNNACGTNGTSINCTSGSMTNIFSDYNVLDPTVDADYIKGANDTTNVNAGLTIGYLPSASGNCDGTGSTNIWTWVGDSDPFGFVMIYLSTRVSRGAREIPAIYAGAVLYPDYY